MEAFREMRQVLGAAGRWWSRMMPRESLYADDAVLLPKLEEELGRMMVHSEEDIDT